LVQPRTHSLQFHFSCCSRATHAVRVPTRWQAHFGQNRRVGNAIHSGLCKDTQWLMFLQSGCMTWCFVGATSHVCGGRDGHEDRIHRNEICVCRCTHLALSRSGWRDTCTSAPSAAMAAHTQLLSTHLCAFPRAEATSAHTTPHSKLPNLTSHIRTRTVTAAPWKQLHTWVCAPRLVYGRVNHGRAAQHRCKCSERRCVINALDSLCAQVRPCLSCWFRTKCTSSPIMPICLHAKLTNHNGRAWRVVVCLRSRKQSVGRQCSCRYGPVPGPVATELDRYF